jgi:hypothetical protein
MKKILLLTLTVLVFSCFSSISVAQSYWTYNEYARVTKNGVTMFIVEYGIASKGWDGDVKWKITNLSSVTVYNVFLEDHNITLSGKEPKHCLSQIFKSTLGPGETGTTEPDYLLTSAKNPPSLEKISFPKSIVTFKTDAKGERVGWEYAGNVSVKSN